MQQSVDNAGWATFGTVVGMFTAAQQLTQFAMAMVTLITGMVVAHFLKQILNYLFPAGFLKRLLNRYFPPKDGNKEESED